jgi:hypothetical protein
LVKEALPLNLSETAPSEREQFFLSLLDSLPSGSLFFAKEEGGGSQKGEHLAAISKSVKFSVNIII